MRESQQTIKIWIFSAMRCRRLGVLAEFERALIAERTCAGMAAAKRRGIYVGRPKKLTSYQLAHAHDLIMAGGRWADAAALVGVNVSTLRRALKSIGS
ncbi:MAG: TniR protein [Verrucomicrobiales bacterium]|nr:TniR protein [Verrucomicrobiales bacterium]